MGDFLAIILCLALFAGMLGLLEAGFRMAQRFQLTRGNDTTAIFDTAVFALLGLLLAFAFSGGVDRLNHRRDLIVDEANAISSAYMRVDLLPFAQQAPVRALYRDYLAARLDFYRVVDGGGDSAPTQKRIVDLQSAIWRASIAGVSAPAHQFAAEPVVEAVNTMVDITTARSVALDTRLPSLVVVLLFGMSLICALLAGAGMARNGERRLVHAGIFAAAVSLTIYTILDLDDPRGGFIRMDAAEQALSLLAAEI